MAQQKELMLNLLKTFVSSALLLFSSRFSSFFPRAVLFFIMQGRKRGGQWGRGKDQPPGECLSMHVQPMA